MKIRKIILIIIVICLMTGCGEQKSENKTGKTVTVIDHKQNESKVESKVTVTPVAKEKTLESRFNVPVKAKTIKSSVFKVPRGMNLYKKMSFRYKGKKWKIQMYAGADIDRNGELELDDRCRFLIRAIGEGKKYILFDDIVQLGVPSVKVFADMDDVLHVIIEDSSTASFIVYDNMYDFRKKTFSKSSVCSYEGINMIGEPE